MSTLDRAPSHAASDAVRDRRIGTGLVVVPVVYLSAAAVLSLVFVSGPPPRLTGHLDGFTQGLTLYRWGFVGASLLAPTLVTTLVLLLAGARVPLDSVRRWVGSLLLASYVPFATIAYTSQYTILPGLVDRDPQAAALWYLHDPTSIPYALDLTGYAVLAIAAIVLASTLPRHGLRWRWIAGLLIGMGVLSLVAFALHAADLSTPASVASGASALFTLPVMALAIAEGRALRRSAGARQGR